MMNNFQFIQMFSIIIQYTVICINSIRRIAISFLNLAGVIVR